SSIRPAPKTGVGMRKITLRLASAVAKSGCASTQPGASSRPWMVKIACTPPSGDPSAFFTKRASRTGPFSPMNAGSLLSAPRRVGNRPRGLACGPVAAGRRRGMAAAAGVEVHRRTETVGDVFDFVEVFQALVEDRELVRGQPGERPAGIGPATAHARVAREEIDRCGDLRMEEQETDYRRDN